MQVLTDTPKPPQHTDVCDAYYHGICLDPLNMPRMGYEQNEVDIVRQVIHPGMRVLLAGFGKGYLALICATIVGAGNVVSYEAEPVLTAFSSVDVRYMGKSLAPKHGAITVRNEKLDGKAPATMTRVLWRADTWESSTLLPQGKERRGTRVMVPGYDINEEIKRHRIDALVLDVEGYEDVLLSAVHLPPIKAIVVEIHHEKVESEPLVHLLQYRGFVSQGWKHHPQYPVSVLGMARV